MTEPADATVPAVTVDAAAEEEAGVAAQTAPGAEDAMREPPCAAR